MSVVKSGGDSSWFSYRGVGIPWGTKKLELAGASDALSGIRLAMLSPMGADYYRKDGSAWME